VKITWNELVANIADLSSLDILADWRWLVPSQMNLVLVSALGDAFFEDAEGRIHWLDTGGAELTCIADSMVNFDLLRQLPENAEVWFIPLLVGDLLESGKILNAGQCFIYVIPLTLGGEITPANFEVCDISVHFRVLGGMQEQLKDVPVGTKITDIKVK
jgi:hypothetical protein